MQIKQGIDLIYKAYEQERDLKLWQMWLTLFPNMTEKDFISFSEYKNKVIDKTSDSGKQQTDEQMMAMCRMLNAAFGGKVVEI